MWSVLKARCQQRKRTIKFPAGEPSLPDRFRGRPILKETGNPELCPARALSRDAQGLKLDLGRCIFCAKCRAGAVEFSGDYRLAVRRREDLIIRPGQEELVLAAALDAESRRIFGRSLKLRQVSAGGCNACEADINVLTTVVFDLGRFGINFVAAPRHADGLLITGPVTENMRLAVEKTYAAVPEPKLVIAVGACAVSGGLFAERAQTHNGAGGILPVDLFVPGCPPHPITILDGLLRLLGRIR